MKLLLTIMSFSLILCSNIAFAEPTANEQKTVIRGRSDVVMTSKVIRLEHLAEITGDNPQAILELKKIEFGDSPLPNASREYKAEQIVASLQSHGVDLKKVGYLLPQAIKVTRASRQISEPEVRAVVEQALRETSRDLEVKDIRFSPNTQIFTGDVQLSARLSSNQTPGQFVFNVAVKSSDGDEISFDARAQVDEWRQLPIATRPLKSGTILGINDIVMARLNANQLPKDTASAQNDLIGLKVQKDVGLGEVFRLGNIEIPPIIESGGRVLLLYTSGALRASASGTALEAGHVGQSINVRNDNSKKVVRGTVKESGLVEVSQ